MDLGSPYFLLLAIGLALGCRWVLRWGERIGIRRLTLVDVCIAAVVGGLSGRLIRWDKA